MDVAVREKLNNGYITRTYDMFQKGISRSVQKVRAFLASMTRAGGGSVRIGYKKLSEKLNVSKTSIWRSVGGERLGEDYTKTRNDGASTYTYTGEWDEKIGRHVRTELFFYTEVFDGVIYKKNGEKIEVERTLHDSEVDVLSLIYAISLSSKGKFIGSPTSISEILHMNYSTAWRALDYLMAFGLIFRTKKGVNGSDDKSEYVANLKLIRALKRTHKAPAQAEMEAQAERRAYYTAQEQQRQAKADKYKKQVFEQVPRYRELFNEARDVDMKMGIMQAKIELGQAEPKLYQILEEKARVLRERMASLEQRMNIIPARFKPEYYGKKQCEKCNGTGKLGNGEQCDCWLRRQT